GRGSALSCCLIAIAFISTLKHVSLPLQRFHMSKAAGQPTVVIGFRPVGLAPCESRYYPTTRVHRTRTTWAIHRLSEAVLATHGLAGPFRSGARSRAISLGRYAQHRADTDAEIARNAPDASTFGTSASDCLYLHAFEAGSPELRALLLRSRQT